MDATLDLDSIPKMDEDTLLANCAKVKLELKIREGLLNAYLDELTRRYESGAIETPSFTFNDTKFSYNPGRTTWTYPESVNQKAAELAQLQNQAKESGTATCSKGAPFWKIKLPSLPNGEEV